MTTDHTHFIEELVDYFLKQGYIVHGARGLEGYKTPPAIANDGFGDLRERVPDVIGVDRERNRIVFGIARHTAEQLDNEESLTDYNVYLDHKHAAGPHASLLVVLLPSSLLSAFTTMLTHYVHREYWHRVVPVSSRVAEEKP